MSRCICVWQRTSVTRWELRLIHPHCPQHGNGGHWKAAA
jgi:hypothetical protein